MTNQVTQFSLKPETFAQAIEASERFASSGMVPKLYTKSPDNPRAADKIIIAWELGASLGLGLMQSLQSIAVINGMPTIWGDSAPAIVIASGLCEDITEEIIGDMTNPTTKAVCTVKRKGKSVRTFEFSIADAMTAGLWKKAGPWTQYPKRMLQMRARSFALRDVFPDVLKGFKLAEEVQDYVNPHPDAIDVAPVKAKSKKSDNPLNNALDAVANEPEKAKIINGVDQSTGEVMDDADIEINPAAEAAANGGGWVFN